ncbi:hypothetical protein ACIQ7Q_25075 [Streptomyces sp. NPDC096176]|uniref:hypothetical protein n=1 Tax=Streptomyces sp. NPDC096176 TaxID=3366079 RepID=UPI0038255DDF
MFAAIVVAGLWQPGGQQPPATGGSVPAAPAHHEAGQGVGDGGVGEEGLPGGGAASSPRGGSASTRPAEANGG